jgi:cell division protease FtsH
MQSDEKTSSVKDRLPLGLLSIAVFSTLLILFLGSYGSTKTLKVPYTEFKDKVSQGGVSEITVQGNRIIGTFKNPMQPEDLGGELPHIAFETVVPPFSDPGLMKMLEKNGVTIKAKSDERSLMFTMAIYVLPWMLILAFFIYSNKKAQRQLGGTGGGLVGFGKSKAKLHTKSGSDTTFKDVAGLANAKKEFYEIIDFLKNPTKYSAIGAKLPKGILLAGPPGTGKTLMARATAGEAGVPFYSISGSEFMEMFVGVGASRVRDTFENAKKNAPAILFIDELDSIGRIRGVGVGGGHDEREQTLNQILAEMDGFDPHTSVIVMAATNRPDILDPALVRPGRFDRQITLDLPQKASRKEILELHAREVPLADDVDLESLAKRTVGFSGAELKNLINEAALLAARKNKNEVDNTDFEQGMDKILMGIEREDLISEDEKEAVAYHEAGHALMAKLLPGTDPLKRVSIIPRGRSLGATEQLPQEDRHNYGRHYLLDRIAILLGGRVAEKLIYNDITTGAGDDLKKATQLAVRMVCQWGMSDEVGPATFHRGEIHPYLGSEMSDSRDYSESTARLIDEEIRTILRKMEERSDQILRANMEMLKALANALLEKETLTKEEVDELLRPITPQMVWHDKAGIR